MELLGDGGNRHHLAGVPEQMAQHHQTGSGGEGSVNRLYHGGIALGLITPQLLNRQHIDGEVLAPGQFRAGTHNTGMLAVADQQPVPFGQGQPPERQHAAAGDVFGEGKPVGRNTAALGQKAASAVHLLGDVGPHIRREGP